MVRQSINKSKKNCLIIFFHTPYSYFDQLSIDLYVQARNTHFSPPPTCDAREYPGESALLPSSIRSILCTQRHHYFISSNSRLTSARPLKSDSVSSSSFALSSAFPRSVPISPPRGDTISSG